MRILAVDDDPLFLEVLETILADAGHAVVRAEDGVRGWQLFSQEPFSVVLCDWQMPHLDGLELCRLIRKSRVPGYTYVILITGRAGRQNYLEGMEAGADDFMEKPVDEQLLLARLAVARRILSLHGRVQTLEGLLPICSYCKRIKDDGGSWTQMERYIADRSSASFSHSICEQCYQETVLPQLAQFEKRQDDLR